MKTARGDRYPSYAELKRQHREGIDYTISHRCVDTSICVFSPHGGSIEPGVSNVVRSVARDEYSWYLFEGLQRSKNKDLHLTSHKFNEPVGVEFVMRHNLALAIHGHADKENRATYVGGLDNAAGRVIADSLRKGGFIVSDDNEAHLAGEDPNNICNRCANLKGVQLEVTRALRDAFFSSGDAGRRDRGDTTEVFLHYVTSVREAVGTLKRLQAGHDSKFRCRTPDITPR